MLNDEDPLPCDMLLLSCADQDGLCYVDTAGLDGETKYFLPSLNNVLV